MQTFDNTTAEDAKRYAQHNSIIPGGILTVISLTFLDSSSSRLFPSSSLSAATPRRVHFVSLGSDSSSHLLACPATLLAALGIL
eukprot:1341680-Rhodomonas_salina.1